MHEVGTYRDLLEGLKYICNARRLHQCSGFHYQRSPSFGGGVLLSGWQQEIEVLAKIKEKRGKYNLIYI